MPVVRWSGHADSVGAVAASQKPGPWNSSGSSAGGAAAAFVVSGAADRTLQRWDVPCRAIATLEEAARDSREAAAAAAAAAVVDDSGKGKAKGGRGAGAGMWTPPAPLLETARRSVRAHEQDVNCVAVSPNDAIVASASQDRTIKLWKAADLELVGVLKGHKRGVWKVCVSCVYSEVVGSTPRSRCITYLYLLPLLLVLHCKLRTFWILGVLNAPAREILHCPLSPPYLIGLCGGTKIFPSKSPLPSLPALNVFSLGDRWSSAPWTAASLPARGTALSSCGASRTSRA